MRRLVLLVLLAACAGDDDGGPIDIDDLDGALVNAYCNLYIRCGLVEDLATCRTLDLDAEVDPDLIAAVKAGKVIYHADKAAECLAGLAPTCSVAAIDQADNVACDETFEGTVAAGGACAIDQECISQTCDVPACGEACCQGTCVGDTPPTRPRVGEACGGATSFNCIASFCDPQTSLCTPYVADGQPCTQSIECASGLCGADQLCTALPGPGEPCDVTTGQSRCREVGYTCSATQMKCVARGLDGDPCTSASDCSPIYQCGTSGTCELRPTLGDECGTQAVPSGCIDHSYCDEATMQCTAPKADGAPCTADGECQSDHCDFATSTCMTPAICI